MERGERGRETARYRLGQDPIVYCAACATIYSLAPLSPRAPQSIDDPIRHPRPRHALHSSCTMSHTCTDVVDAMFGSTDRLSAISALNFSLQRTLRDSVHGAPLRRYAPLQGYRKPGHEGHAAERGARGAGVLSETARVAPPSALCPKVEQDPPAAIFTAVSSAEGVAQTGGGSSGI